MKKVQQEEVLFFLLLLRSYAQENPVTEVIKAPISQGISFDCLIFFGKKFKVGNLLPAVFMPIFIRLIENLL